MSVKINGEYIPDAAVEFELGRLIRFYSQHMDASQVREQMDALKKRAVEQAIGAKLLIAEASRLCFKVSEADIDKSLKQMIASAGGDEALAGMMKSQHLTIDAVRENIREGCRVDKLIEKITEGTPDPSDAETKAHFESHSREYARPERSQAQHILIKPASGSDDDKEAAWKKLEGIRVQVENGSDFSDLAGEYSDCPSGANTGGSLGWFSRGMMVPEFDKVVFGMDVGDLSDIVETQFGYHIIMKTAKEDACDADYDDVKENVRDFLRHVKRGEVIAAYVQELREKAIVEID